MKGEGLIENSLTRVTNLALMSSNILTNLGIKSNYTLLVSVTRGVLCVRAELSCANRSLKIKLCALASELPNHDHFSSQRLRG